NRLPLHKQINKIVGDFTSLLLLEVNYTNCIPGQDTFLSRALKLQDQLGKDIDNKSISGIEVLREIRKYKSEGYTSALMPVVFTCVLGMEEESSEDKIQEFFQDEIYSITQTPQVWLDLKAYEVSGELVIEWDYVE